MTAIERRPVVAGLAEHDWPAGLHPVLRQVLARRHVASAAELELKLAALVPVSRFSQLDAAVDLLLRHKQGTITVVGDFDADGATSTALMLLTLRDLGFARVDFRIPDRFRHGYGLGAELVAELAPNPPDLIVTVDNGISSHDGISAARRLGIDVLVTDHHLPPPQLPDATAIVNPNLTDSAFPGKSLAGVGVAFYLLAALGRALGRPAAVASYLDLVALGTVADLVRLDQSNRILVHEGLRRLRGGQCRPGLAALLEVAGVARTTVTTATLGFRVGPRLNAAGRLDDMSIGVRCLVTDSAAEARELAQQLDGLNRNRQSIEAEMKSEAMAIVDGIEVAADTLPPLICLRGDDWHEGLVGLVASRVKDRYHRPVFAFADTEPGLMKGSGRSIPGFHLRDALATVDVANPGLIHRFGGHAMAAGLTLAAGRFPDFERAMAAVADAGLGEADLGRKVLTDGGLAAGDLTLAVARTLRDALPWGQGFEEPCFDDRFELLERRTLKDLHLKLRLRPVGGGGPVEAIAFHQAEHDWRAGEIRQIAYRLSVNDYFADERVQLIVEHVGEVT